MRQAISAADVNNSINQAKKELEDLQQVNGCCWTQAIDTYRCFYQSPAFWLLRQ
jgi:hypothetical protein